jgi:hypothetical protein
MKKSDFGIQEAPLFMRFFMKMFVGTRAVQRLLYREYNRLIQIDGDAPFDEVKLLLRDSLYFDKDFSFKHYFTLFFHNGLGKGLLDIALPSHYALVNGPITPE